MAYLTRQEIFDRVKAHLLAQGKKAGGYKGYYGSFVCQYRDDRGHKCGVGGLIPDELYDSEMEGRNVSGLFECSNPKWIKSV